MIQRESRLNIIQTLKRENIPWYGELNDFDFLSRIYDLDSMKSYDYRFSSAKYDIITHRVSFDDWDDDWIYEDNRFNLMSCADQEFLRFLCETIHPVVRPDKNERSKMIELFNNELQQSGYEIIESKSVFGNIEYLSKRISQETVETLEEVKELDYLDRENVNKQIERMRSSVNNDPELAVGTAKEFVETISKTILKRLNYEIKKDEDLPHLVYQVFDIIEPIKSSKTPKSQQVVKKIIGTLSTLVVSITELRNLEGTGHGREADSVKIRQENASLVVNSASTLGLYLIKIYENYPLK